MSLGGLVMLAMVSCSKISLSDSAQMTLSPSPTPMGGADTSVKPSALATIQAWLSTPPPGPARGEPPTAPPPTSARTFRPHPAAGAREAALKMYPALAVKDSTFNKTFRDLYAEKVEQDPEFLTKAEWPLVLARRTAELLAPAPATPAPFAMASAPQPSSAAPQPAAPQPAAQPTPNPLDRPAYNQQHSRWWAWTYYYYPRY